MSGSLVKKASFCKAAVFILLSLCALFVSCVQSGDSDSPMLSVVLPGSSSSRVLQPSGFYERSDVASFRITLSAEGSDDVSKTVPYGSDAEFYDLTEGVWAVTVEALDALGVVVAKGISVALVVAGESASVPIVLEMVDYIELFSYDLNAYDSIMAGDKIFKVYNTRQFQQLQALSTDYSKYFNDATILLMADVESASDKYFFSFAGTLDGRKHKITMSRFPLVTGTFEGTITNVILDGNVTESQGGVYAGAFAELSNGGTISKCINRANVAVDGSNGVAGFVGSVLGDTTIEMCGNEGNLSLGDTVAGICAMNAGIGILTISNCYNIGEIDPAGESENSGGIFGVGPDVSYTRISYCYDKHNRVADISDITATDVQMSGCYSGCLGGLGGNCGTLVEDFSDMDLFPMFDFTSVWVIKGGRPVLRDIQ